MVLRVGNVTISQRALLAPMAGITDLPFRNLVARFGAGLVVSEMLASREVVIASKAARAKSLVSESPVPTSVQIAGCDPHWMAEAARLVADGGAALIDINMGCPAKKVTGGWSGSALMREPDRALRLIEAVVGAVDIPVTLKMRLGWDADSINAPEIARRAESAGVQMVTVHGRTRTQFYKGHADWFAIAAVKRAVTVPVVANGDIVDASSARRALATSGADAVMIGRGAKGAPWTPALIGAALEGQTMHTPDLSARLALLIEHYEAILGLYGRKIGVRVARKHLGWALGRVEGTEQLRRDLMRLDCPAQVVAALQNWDEEPVMAEAA